MDGVLTHSYYLTGGDVGRKGLVEDMRELVAMTRQYLPPGAKIMNTEWGLEWRQPPWIDPNALRIEAANFMRGHMIVLGEGADSTFYFYTADISHTSGGGLFYNLTTPHPGCGATNIAPKPVFVAAATATRLLEGTKNLGAIEYLDPNVLGYAFDRRGETVLCLWTKNGKPQTVKLPAGNAKSASFLDPMGNARELSAADGILAVELSGIPSWVRGTDRISLPAKAGGSLVEGLPGENAKLANAQASAKLKLLLNGAWAPAGQGQELSIPKNAAAGTLLLGSFDLKSDALLGCQLLRVKPQVEIAPAKTPVPGSMAFDVKNMSSGLIEGTASIRVDGASCAETPVSLAKGGSGKAIFELRRNGIQLPAGAPQVGFVDKNGASCSFPAPSPKKVLSAKRTLSPPKIDGRLEDWQLELFNTLGDSAKQELSHRLNLRAGAQYDEKNLYLGFKVDDRSHAQTRSPNGLWFGDSIQIGLAVAPDGVSWKSWQKLDFGKNSKTGTLSGYRDMGDAFPVGPLKQGEVSWSIIHDGDETFYEVAIPWNMVGKDLQGPPPEGLLGLGIMVNNVDSDPATGAEGKRECIDGLGGMYWSKPEDFGILELK